jgi:S1-C subfamily serine protease
VVTAPSPSGTAADAAAPAEPAASGRGRRRAGALRRLGPFAGGVAAAFVGLWLFTVVSPPPRPLTTVDVGQQVQNALASLTPGPPKTELIFQQIAPSLVLIQADLAAAGSGEAPLASPDSGSRGDIGTGVVVDTRLDILTSLHVVANATSIQLTFADGSTVPGTVVRAEPENDTAVLRPTGQAPRVPPAVLGDPGRLKVGSEAYVVGHPIGLYGSMSAGVVSGLDRSFRIPESTTILHDLIQVDAAVNPGNSGGPLLDGNGLVVGIVAALVNPSPNRVFAGIGLAVPIDVVASGVGMPPD